MNYDRLLTRVYDKQEKEMLYEGDTFHHMAYPKNKLLFKIAHKNGLLCHVAGNSFDDPWNDIIATIEFSDRFVPMMCQGWIDKNSKLIWEADIINDDIGTGIITLDKKSNYLKIVYPKQNLGKWFIDFLESEKKNIEIIGNIHENEKLLGVKV